MSERPSFVYGRKRTCLYPTCVKVGHSRGLCGTHYATAYNIVNRQKLRTWRQLELAGKARPRVTRRGYSGWFLVGTDLEVEE